MNMTPTDRMPRESPDGKRETEDAGRSARHRFRDRAGDPQEQRDRRLLHRLPHDGGARDPLLLHPVPNLRAAEGEGTGYLSYTSIWLPGKPGTMQVCRPPTLSPLISVQSFHFLFR